MPATDAGCQWECSMVNELPRRRWQGRVGELHSCGLHLRGVVDEQACGGAGTAAWQNKVAAYCYCGMAAGIETNGRGGEGRTENEVVVCQVGVDRCGERKKRSAHCGDGTLTALHNPTVENTL
jgi:hypothetical protein